MRPASLVAFLTFVAVQPAPAQSLDDSRALSRQSRCSFRSATTCWTVWGPRAKPVRALPKAPEERPARDTVPLLARRPTEKRILEQLP